jgi:hypothetical protein
LVLCALLPKSAPTTATSASSCAPAGRVLASIFYDCLGPSILMNDDASARSRRLRAAIIGRHPEVAERVFRL